MPSLKYFSCTIFIHKIGKIKPSTNETTAVWTVRNCSGNEEQEHRRGSKKIKKNQKTKSNDKRNTIMTLGKNPLFLAVIKIYAFLYDNHVMFRAIKKKKKKKKKNSFFEFKVQPDSFHLGKISKSSIMKEISNHFFHYYYYYYCNRCLQCLLNWTAHYTTKYSAENLTSMILLTN